MSVVRHHIRGTRRIVHIVSFSNWSNVVVTNTFLQVDTAWRLMREYSTCIGSGMSVVRRRIRGTRRIVHIISFSNCSNVVVTNTIRDSLKDHDLVWTTDKMRSCGPVVKCAGFPTQVLSRVAVRILLSAISIEVTSQMLITSGYR